MSFIHETLVGHFDPDTLLPGRPWQPVRPLDMAALANLLSECSPEVRDQIEIRDGYVVVHWSAVRGRELMREAQQFAYRLAEEQQCIAAEGPLFWVSYPEWAKEAQNRAGALLKSRKAPAAEPRASPQE